MSPDASEAGSPPSEAVSDSTPRESDPLFPPWLLGLLLMFVLVCVGVVALRMADFRRGSNPPPPHVELEPLTIEKALLVQAAAPHAIPTWIDPDTVTVPESKQIRIGRRGKFLVSTDLVLGVVINGEACAYPVRFLEWFEVVDHTLGGTPITVTWSPLCGSGAVFDRRPRSAKAKAQPARTFTASGMLFNHNLILRDELGCLWSQLLGRAVSGPAASAGLTLEPIPIDVMTWAAWTQAHPETRVVNPPRARHMLLKRSPYGNYIGSDLIRDEFPLDPKPPSEAGIENKSPVLAVRLGPDKPWTVYSIPDLAAQGASVSLEQDGARLVFTTQASPPTATVRRGKKRGRVEAIRSYWFAWYAAHPKSRLHRKSD